MLFHHRGVESRQRLGDRRSLNHRQEGMASLEDAEGHQDRFLADRENFAQFLASGIEFG